MSTEQAPYGDPDTRNRIMATAWDLLSVSGSSLKLGDVAAGAGVSRQAVYLHFGDRTGLLLALVQHMDEVLELGPSLVYVRESPTGHDLLERLMRLNAEFWAAVHPVAQVLEAAQHDDDALGAAWRDRMGFRQMVMTTMVEQLAADGQLAEVWSIEDAAELLYAVTHFDTWRELIHQLQWTDDHYVGSMTRLLCRSFLVS